MKRPEASEKEFLQQLGVVGTNDTYLVTQLNKYIDYLESKIQNIENSVGVSDATAEDGALARDREWHASGENVDSQIASEHVPIGNRISDEKIIFLKAFLAGIRVAKGKNHVVKIEDTMKLVESEWENYLKSE